MLGEKVLQTEWCLSMHHLLFNHLWKSQTIKLSVKYSLSMGSSLQMLPVKRVVLKNKQPTQKFRGGSFIEIYLVTLNIGGGMV